MMHKFKESGMLIFKAPYLHRSSFYISLVFSLFRSTWGRWIYILLSNLVL